jgi:hypothetical protein
MSAKTEEHESLDRMRESIEIAKRLKAEIEQQIAELSRLIEKAESHRDLKPAAYAYQRAQFIRALDRLLERECMLRGKR